MGVHTHGTIPGHHPVSTSLPDTKGLSYYHSTITKGRERSYTGSAMADVDESISETRMEVDEGVEDAEEVEVAEDAADKEEEDEEGEDVMGKYVDKQEKMDEEALTFNKDDDDDDDELPDFESKKPKKKPKEKKVQKCLLKQLDLEDDDDDDDELPDFESKKPKNKNKNKNKKQTAKTKTNSKK